MAAGGLDVLGSEISLLKDNLESLSTPITLANTFLSIGKLRSASVAIFAFIVGSLSMVEDSPAEKCTNAGCL